MSLMDDLRGLDRSKVQVKHKPMTERYTLDATARLQDVILKGKVLGTIDVSTSLQEKRIEIIIWVEPLNEGEAGLYTGVRLQYWNGNIKAAVFFCFYNGKYQSPALFSEFEARQFMKKHETPYLEIFT